MFHDPISKMEKNIIVVEKQNMMSLAESTLANIMKSRQRKMQEQLIHPLSDVSNKAAMCGKISNKHVILSVSASNIYSSPFNVFNYFQEFFQGEEVLGAQRSLCSQIPLRKPGTLNMQGCLFKRKDVELVFCLEGGNRGGY